jgi:hypothetical protein
MGLLWDTLCFPSQEENEIVRKIPSPSSFPPQQYFFLEKGYLFS